MTPSIFPDNEKNKTEKGVLYLVATPIGNSADISERAVKVLAEADFIAAEDTRNSGRLISNLGIKQTYFPYHDHNRTEAGQKIVERLKQGETCALVTDAGMPGISDPGYDLVSLCAKEGIKVTCVPGPCAFVTALALSGLDTSSFVFEGFLKGSESDRKKTLSSLASLPKTLIFYEAPHRIKETLTFMLSVFGDRRVSLCRELTKINEEIIRTTLEDAARLCSEKEPRGEYVVVIEGKKAASSSDWQDITIEEHIRAYVENEGMSTMDAVKKVASDRGLKKGDVYKYTIKDRKNN